MWQIMIRDKVEKAHFRGQSAMSGEPDRTPVARVLQASQTTRIARTQPRPKLRECRRVVVVTQGRDDVRIHKLIYDVNRQGCVVANDVEAEIRILFERSLKRVEQDVESLLW